MTPRDLRVHIMRKHARLGPAGQLSLCSAQRGAHPNGKVIFRSETAARACAEELFAWGAALRQDVYRCPAGKHFHMTKIPQNGAA